MRRNPSFSHKFNTTGATAWSNKNQQTSFAPLVKGALRSLSQCAILISRQNRQRGLPAFLTYFEPGEITDFDAFAEEFRCKDDAVLVKNLNEHYGLSIEPEDFIRGYKWVKHASIDRYLFREPEAKNASDLAAWCRNAYEAEWAFKPGGGGEIDENLHRRTVDNVGLLLGYFNYDPAEKCFGRGVNTLIYTVQGGMETLPDLPGVGVFTGAEFGVYDGSEAVFFASADGRDVQKIPVTDGRFQSWCTFAGIDYPQEVEAAIAAIRAQQNHEEMEE